jgi:Zn-finger nucleic acid-binding protein
METCPRCRVTLAPGKIAEEAVEECANCGGAWLSVFVFRQFCSDPAAQTTLLSIMPPAIASSEKRVEYLPCPACAKIMNRVRFAQGCNVVTHACISHGIWVAVPALQDIIIFVRGGGLVRAKRKEKEESQRRRDMAFLSSILDAYPGMPGPLVM